MTFVMLGGCSFAYSPVLPSETPTTINYTSPGHWEIVRQIDYGSIPETNLKGANDPAYLLYLVTVAGFHSDAFGITVGPDDDVRYTTDGGQSWTRSTNALHCRHGLEVVDEYVAWHCGNGGTRVSTDGGQTWDTDNNYSWGAIVSSNSAGPDRIGTTPDDAIHVSAPSVTEPHVHSGRIRIYNPSDTAGAKLGIYDSVLQSASESKQQRGFGFYLPATAINAVRLMATVGNFSAGSVRCTGIK